VWSAPLERYLQLIGQHRRAWLWANGFMLTAAVLNATGLAVLAFQANQPPIVAGAAGYSIAAVFWILIVTFRSTVSIWAADELEISHRVPDSFVGIDRWSGMNFQLYTAMGHAAQAVVGLGLLATPLVPKVGGGVHGRLQSCWLSLSAARDIADPSPARLLHPDLDACGPSFDRYRSPGPVVPNRELD